jgi:hypothetical protein
MIWVYGARVGRQQNTTAQCKIYYICGIGIYAMERSRRKKMVHCRITLIVTGQCGDKHIFYTKYLLLLLIFFFFSFFSRKIHSKKVNFICLL